MTDTELAALIAWAEDRLPELTEEACGAILARIPFYRDASVVQVPELRRSVGQNLRFLVTALRDPHAPLDLRAPKETGRRRAQQSAPLPEVLQAYRICFATLWDALVAQARRNRHPAQVDALLTAVSLIWQLTDEHAIAVTEAYRAATAELLLARQQRRSALVEALMTGHPGPDGGPWEAASLLGFPPDGQLVVVAAETRGLAEESLPGIEKQLAGHGVVSGWRLTPALHLGLVALPASSGDAVLSILQKAATARTGVSPPYHSLSETPRALQLARTALVMLPTGRIEVQVFDASPLAGLMAMDPREGRRIAQQVLGPVLALAVDDRAVLLDTLNAHLDHGGSAEQAGDILHCHPNTVRYRLRRLQELTGRSLSDPRQASELAAAAYAVRLLPVTTAAVGGDNVSARIDRQVQTRP
ncbi:PucR family transcriptional regulator [Kribbella kalugense]|uniref:PucR-like helix-turn-helix protein n=1 Tax=Kribbella kalugense TaxID=2512221 RepID=A0A4R7ZUX8_9ACTN|nr:helix-turn-helix domain-containing protein [Kribbella kalugense]TDW21859.1 PucR-like helix-turn-helix protein [Kribbella kalugense]